MKKHSELENMHKSALRLVQGQIKRHSLGTLGFLSFVGTRPWGIAQANVDFDYRGIYISRQDNTYQAFISGLYINNYAKDITMVSLEKFIVNILQSNIHSFISINSPVIYASKEFLEFRNWVNSNFSKQVYQACQTKPQGHTNRKDYLYDFFFIGNGISVLGKKKVIPNLPELNKKVLKISSMNKIIEEEKAGLPFETEQLCEEVLNRLKARLDKANKGSHLPEEIDVKSFTKLKIIRRINYRYWNHDDFIKRHLKEREKYELE